MAQVEGRGTVIRTEVTTELGAFGHPKKQLL